MDVLGRCNHPRENDEPVLRPRSFARRCMRLSLAIAAAAGLAGCGAAAQRTAVFSDTLARPIDEAPARENALAVSQDAVSLDPTPSPPSLASYYAAAGSLDLRATGEDLFTPSSLDASLVAPPPAVAREQEWRTPKWTHMMAEATLLFGVQEFFYWTIMKPENVVDFDYGINGRSARARFVTFEAWRLDNNMYDTNALRHPAQGMANYLFARSNYLSVPSSYLFSIALSTAWEIAGEYRELVSVNDIVMTPATAMPIAESFAQMSAFFGLYDWMDRARPHWMRNLGAVWLEGPIWHDFRLGLEGGFRAGASGAAPSSRLALDTEIIRIPGYGLPGTGDHLMINGNFSQIVLRTGFDEGGLNDLLFFTRAALLTFYYKSITPDASRGYDIILGVSSAFEYSKHWLGPDHDTRWTRDQAAIAHLLGPTIDGRARHGKLELRAVIDLYGDFAMVRNYALTELQAAEGDENMKSSVVRERYHYALGMSGMARVMARYDRLEAGLQAQTDVFDSIEGLDRNQAQLMTDYNLRDSRKITRMWLSYELPVRYGSTNTRLGISFTERKREGTAGDYSDSTREHELLGGMLLAF
jgi:hypothetical protein